MRRVDLHLISEDKIDFGDYFIELDIKGTRSSYVDKVYYCDIGNTGGFILTHNSGNFPFPNYCKKIIMSTNIC